MNVIRCFTQHNALQIKMKVSNRRKRYDVFTEYGFRGNGGDYGPNNKIDSCGGSGNDFTARSHYQI